jgi:hypothetical protein
MLGRELTLTTILHSLVYHCCTVINLLFTLVFRILSHTVASCGQLVEYRTRAKLLQKADRRKSPSPLQSPSQGHCHVSLTQGYTLHIRVAASSWIAAALESVCRPPRACFAITVPGLRPSSFPLSHTVFCPASPLVLPKAMWLISHGARILGW